MKFSLPNLTFLERLGVTVGVLSAILALCTGKLAPAVGALLFGGLPILTIYLNRWDNNRLECRIKSRTAAQLQYFAAQLDELQRLLANGKLSYAVEWWEQDELDLDENAHMLFIFHDGTEMDFVLHAPTSEKLQKLLSTHGIAWQYRFQQSFDSRIVYPPLYKGQPYYTPDGTRRPELPAADNSSHHQDTTGT